MKPANDIWKHRRNDAAVRHGVVNFMRVVSPSPQSGRHVIDHVMLRCLKRLSGDSVLRSFSKQIQAGGTMIVEPVEVMLAEPGEVRVVMEPGDVMWVKPSDLMVIRPGDVMV
eukprot:6209104-Pleurochrysis_carterae.AAC.1